MNELTQIRKKINETIEAVEKLWNYRISDMKHYHTLFDKVLQVVNNLESKLKKEEESKELQRHEKHEKTVEELQSIQQAISILESNASKSIESVWEVINDIYKEIDIIWNRVFAEVDHTHKEFIDIYGSIGEKADKVHEHKQYALSSDLKQLNNATSILQKSIQECITNNEIEVKLKKYIKKDDVYNKQEIDKKFDDNQLFVRWWWHVSSYTPFITITNAERLLLTPSIWYTVYCTDEIEWLYIYTSDWRQRFSMAVVM